ncbi:transcriptional regulator, LacI family [Actinomyces ruminicola]|uniref:Transcriptional regulator, LacI family n=1 Tax=Actinomyces ruminicola TaxID=332524 RepID=A0A1H0E6I0_9ACTO|nr:LacI family DNA-binding transcriptional regulator [Actinomyces ruminicola]SDN78017.1 transcriptional regulator, LacI family [Actinomyces ruminicola]
MARPSVRDVAERAGVSVGTVSHVLNHPDRVAQPTLDRVRAAIDELGFVRSEAARRLRHGGSSLVGVLVHDISNPFFTEAARGIEDRLREGGRVPMLGSTDSDPERERELMSLLAGMDVHGVIVTPSVSTLDNLAVLAGRGIRVVLMDHPPISAELSTVSGDDVAGARAAVSHLIGLGHRRIGFVNGPLTVRQAADRRDGVVAALAEAGMDPAHSLLETEAVSGGQGFTADAGAVGAAALLGDETPPTALFCANDQLAIGAMREIRRRGLSIPDDVAIVGYDDISVASELITPLTSVRQPMREMGAAAADLLLSDGGGVRHIVFPPELIVRESTVGK